MIFLSNELKLKFIGLLGWIKVNFIHFTNIFSIRKAVQLIKLYKHLIKTKKLQLKHWIKWINVSYKQTHKEKLERGKKISLNFKKKKQ